MAGSAIQIKYKTVGAIRLCKKCLTINWLLAKRIKLANSPVQRLICTHCLATL